MPTLRLQFPGGRYHATPWGHHVNEGQIEWPPSPWRLLRALIACGFNTQGWSEIPPIARQLIEKLAATLPSYRLPGASAAHSRHFMPLGTLDKGREKTTLVFDTWADVSDECLEIHWDCELTDDETRLLGQLADCLGYLGRSESWVEAKLLQVGDGRVNGFDAMPHQAGLCPGPKWEQVAVMAAIPPDDYFEWRTSAAAKVLAEFSTPEGKNNRKPTPKQLRDHETAKKKAVAPFPNDLLDCLIKDTAWWKQHRWSQPPGSQRVVYWRPAGTLEVGVPKRSTKRPARPVTTMLLALTTPGGNQSALPSVTRTLPQAELFHRAIVGRVANGGRVHCPEITGKNQHGLPLRGPHQHAHIIPLALEDARSAQRRLDHILIHAPMGLGDAAQRAIRTLRRTWTKGGIGDLQVALVALGHPFAWKSLPGSAGRVLSLVTGPEEGATRWISRTPFVLPRYPKARGKNSIYGQLNAELASRRLPEAVTVEVLQEETKAFRHFVTVRRSARGNPPSTAGLAVRLTLAAPIRGPLLLGYGSHFGLGLFESERT